MRRRYGPGQKPAKKVWVCLLGTGPVRGFMWDQQGPAIPAPDVEDLARQLGVGLMATAEDATFIHPKGELLPRGESVYPPGVGVRCYDFTADRDSFLIQRDTAADAA